MADLPTPRADTATAKEEARYDAEYLERNARSLLSTRPQLVAGALATQKRKTFTLVEAEKAVKEYVKRPVKLAGAEEEG